jgi:hypothetical protein
MSRRCRSWYAHSLSTVWQPGLIEGTSILLVEADWTSYHHGVVDLIPTCLDKLVILLNLFAVSKTTRRLHRQPSNADGSSFSAWLTPNSTSAEIFDAIPLGFTFLSTPRPVPDARTSSVIGGGTAFLIRVPFTLLSSPTTTFKSFEMLTVTHSKHALFNIYLPPSSPAKSRDVASFSQFLEDLQTLISSISTTPFEFLITNDFNIHVDDPTDSNALKFISLLDLANLTQHVPFSTHVIHVLLIVSFLLLILLYLLLLPLHSFFHLIIFLSFTLLTFPPSPVYVCLSN